MRSHLFINRLFLFLGFLVGVSACNLSSPKENLTNTPPQESKVVENEPSNGIFRQQKNFTVDSIAFSRHQITIREGQNEETIIYTTFDDKAKFEPLNALIAEYANLARLDSIKISKESNMEAEDSEYETVQRIDTVYILNQETISVAFHYSFMANGMECENKENKLFTYSTKTKKVMTLKDIFGAKIGEVQKNISTILKKQFLKDIDEFTESSFQKPDNEDFIALKKEIEDSKVFFENLSFMLTPDSLAFSYPVGKNCNLPPYLSGKIALKTLEK
jgi:hypothetical protein